MLSLLLWLLLYLPDLLRTSAPAADCPTQRGAHAGPGAVPVEQRADATIDAAPMEYG
jgi:hypothetical protein